MMKRPCLTRPFLHPIMRKRVPMNRAWRPDRKRRRKKKSKEAIITTYPLSHGVSIICDICGSVDVSRVS